jgi:hypothetical protein
MAECPHYGSVTWFSGSGQHFRRFNQIRQPNGAGIGTRYGTAHKKYPSARPIRVESMNHEDADAENDTRCRDYLGHPAKTPQFPMADDRSARTELQPCCAKSLRNG